MLEGALLASQVPQPTCSKSGGDPVLVLAHILISPLSSLSANESLREVGRTFLVETDAKYRVEQTPEKNSDMLCEESVREMSVQ